MTSTGGCLPGQAPRLVDVKRADLDLAAHAGFVLEFGGTQSARAGGTIDEFLGLDPHDAADREHQLAAAMPVQRNGVSGGAGRGLRHHRSRRKAESAL